MLSPPRLTQPARNAQGHHGMAPSAWPPHAVSKFVGVLGLKEVVGKLKRAHINGAQFLALTYEGMRALRITDAAAKSLMDAIKILRRQSNTTVG